MFTWICPKCGKEVPPHENECPYCHGTGKIEEPASEAPQAPPPQNPQQPGHYFQQPQQPPQHQPPAAPPPPQQYAPPPAQPQNQPPVPPQQQYAPPPPVPQQPPPAYAPPQPPPPPAQQAYAPPPAGPPPGEQQYYEVGASHGKGLPGWAVMVIVAVAVIGLGYLLYTFVLPSNQSSVAGGQGSIGEVAETPMSPEAARIGRHLEATGFRISEDSQQNAQAQFLIINHSAADIGNLAGFVNIRVHDASPDDPPLFHVEFEADKLGPYESIEFKTSIKTDLRAYEIPDWQFLRGQVNITSPSSSE